MLATCNIPKFDDSLVESDGIRACLDSPAWAKKKAAFEALTSFVSSSSSSAAAAAIPPLLSSLLSVVKHVTKSFKDSNVNVMKAAFELLAAVAASHSPSSSALPSSFARLAVQLGVDSLHDKKLKQAPSDLVVAVLTATESTNLALVRRDVHGERLRQEAQHRVSQGPVRPRRF